MANDGTDLLDAPKNLSGVEFSRHSEGTQAGILRECWDFLRYHKKWWLAPILLVTLLLGLLVMLSSTAAAPFVYTLW